MKNQLAFGVVGAGYFGSNYIRLLQDMPGAVLRAVADRSLETIKNMSLLPASVRQCAEAEEVFSDPEIDCVVIATPALSHYGLIVQALEHGKHVLVEKPLAMNTEAAERIRDAVEHSGCLCMVGHQYLYNDYIRHLKKKLDEGMLGSIKYIFAEHLSFGPIRSDIGCFGDAAVHELSIIDYLFSPGEIRDARGRSVDFLQSGRNDFAVAEVLFENGITAAIVVSRFAPEKVRRMTIAGDKGMAVFDERREEKLKFFLHPYPPAAAAAGGASRFLQFSENEIVIPSVSTAEPLRNQLERFIFSIREGTEPVSGINHGLRVTRMMDAISRAIA